MSYRLFLPVGFICNLSDRYRLTRQLSIGYEFQYGISASNSRWYSLKDGMHLQHGVKLMYRFR